MPMSKLILGNLVAMVGRDIEVTTKDGYRTRGNLTSVDTADRSIRIDNASGPWWYDLCELRAVVAR